MLKLNEQIARTQAAKAEFSIAEARHIVKDLFEPNPWIYWTDLLVSYGAAMAAVAASRRLELPWPVLPLLFAVSVFGFYRAALFTHELVHLRKGTFRGFRVAWNALVGIPLLLPSFLYYTHTDHHARRHYGTSGDGEYLPLATGPISAIFVYLAQAFVVPILAVLRFLVLVPLCWLHPGVRAWVQARASSMVIDPAYVRPRPSPADQRVWYFQEACCFGAALALVAVFATGLRPPSMALHIYLIAVAVLLLNELRTLGAHRYRNRDGEMTFTEQLLDSLNYPNRPWISELWAPVGLRFHALHHLFPSMPYHRLAEAHRRLMAELPADSPYRQTESPSLPAALRQLWRDARSASAAAAGVGGGGRRA